MGVNLEINPTSFENVFLPGMAGSDGKSFKMV